MKANTLQSKDLRIGNVLHYTTAENDVLETTIDWQDLKWISEDPKGFNLAHDTIPLSEEWLLKLGFDENYRSEFTIKLELNESQEVGFKRNQNFGWNFYYKGQMISNINFIHQIQNLTFALTEIELTIKE